MKYFCIILYVTGVLWYVIAIYNDSMFVFELEKLGGDFELHFNGKSGRDSKSYPDWVIYLQLSFLYKPPH